MAVEPCPTCGAPLLGTASACPYCGTPTPLAASAGPPAVAPPPPLPGGPAAGGTAPPPPRRSPWRIVAVVLVVLILVVGVAAVLFVPAPATVRVQEIDVWTLDNVCGLGDNPVAFNGYNDSAGGSTTLEFALPNFNATACTIHSIATNTSGFAFHGSATPWTIPGHSTLNLTLTVDAPSGAYDGVLHMDLL